jgi:hypothetical protein
MAVKISHLIFSLILICASFVTIEECRGSGTDSSFSKSVLDRDSPGSENSYTFSIENDSHYDDCTDVKNPGTACFWYNKIHVSSLVSLKIPEYSTSVWQPPK